MIAGLKTEDEASAALIICDRAGDDSIYRFLAGAIRRHCGAHAVAVLIEIVRVQIRTD